MTEAAIDDDSPETGFPAVARLTERQRLDLRDALEGAQKRREQIKAYTVTAEDHLREAADAVLNASVVAEDQEQREHLMKCSQQIRALEVRVWEGREPQPFPRSPYPIGYFKMHDPSD